MDQFRILYKFNPNKFISKKDINDELVKLNASIPSVPDSHDVVVPSVEDIYTYVKEFNTSITEIFSQKNLSVIKLVPLISGEFSNTNECSMSVISDAIDLNSYSNALTNFFVSDSIYTHADYLKSFEGDSSFTITLNFKYDFLLNQDEYYVVKANGEYLATKDSSIVLSSKEEVISVGTYTYKNNQGDISTVDSVTALRHIRNGTANIETSPIIKNKKINYLHIEEVFIGKNKSAYPLTASVKLIGIESNSEFTIRNISGYGNFTVMANDRQIVEKDTAKNNEGFIKVILKDKDAVVNYINIEEVL